MKVTHLIFSFNTGGAETMLVDILNEQINHIAVELVIVNSEIDFELLSKLDKRISIYQFGRKERSKNIFPLIRLNRHVLKSKPDIIHCHNHNNIRILLPFLWKKAVLTVHATDVLVDNFKRYKKLFAISRAVSDDISRRCNLNSTIIMNGIDFSQIHNRDSNILRHEEIFKIVQVGRLNTDIKGHHLLINAIRTLREGGIKNVCVDFIGEGKSLGYLQDMVKEYALEEHISFLGLRNRKYIYKHLKSYDLLVQPSLYEGFGLTIVEAMAANIPVLVADIAGPMEIIKHGKYGFFFKTGNWEELAERILFVLEMKKTGAYNEKIKNAREYAAANFDIKQTSINYINNY